MSPFQRCTKHGLYEAPGTLAPCPKCEKEKKDGNKSADVRDEPRRGRAVPLARGDDRAPNGANRETYRKYQREYKRRKRAAS